MTQYDLGRVVGSDGQQGAKGDDGNGIASIVKTGTSGKVDTYTITYTDGDTDTFTVTNGSDGAKGDTGATGNGISSVTKTGSSGLVDTYTITFTSGATTTFQVTNGKDGSDASVTIVSSWSATTSDAKVPSEKLAKTSLDGKVDKVTGKGLSTNDFTNSYKSTIDGLSSVATSGSYSDLSNKPSIPSSSSDLSDGSDLIKKSSTSGLVKNDGSIDTNSYLTTGSASSTYQTKLVSGTSIKTINNESLLGSGNITIQGGSSVDIVTAWETTPSDSKVASEKLVKNSLDAKLDNSMSSSSTLVNIEDNDYPVIADFSDSYKVKRAYHLDAFHIHDSNAHSNIGSNAGTTQRNINSLIDTALGNKVSKSQTTGLLKNDGSVDTSAYITSSAITGMLTTSDVANNLTTTASGKVLDARQGKALADLIGDAIAYINQ